MTTAEQFLKTIEDYIENHFERLVSTPDMMNIYNALMELRAILKLEIAEVERIKTQQNSYYGKIIRMREAKWRRKLYTQTKREVSESMKLAQFMPHR